jgi:hypothetical protein
MGDLGKLRNGVDMILRSSPNYSTVERFVDTRKYFFSNSNPLVVETEIPKSIRAIVKHPKSDLWSEDVVREKILVRLEDPTLDSPWAKPADPSLSKSAMVSERLQSATEDIYAIYAGEIHQDIDAAKSRKTVAALINFYLRAWIAWGVAGPAIAETMGIIGRDVTLERIRNGRVKLIDVIAVGIGKQPLSELKAVGRSKSKTRKDAGKGDKLV